MVRQARSVEFRRVALSSVMAWQARWVKAWCSEVCCGLLGLGRLGKLGCVGVRYGMAGTACWGELSFV